MNNYKNIIMAGVFSLVIIAAVIMVIDSFSEGRDNPYSSHETGPRGVKGFYLLLEENGLPVQRWNSPLTALEPEEGEKQALIFLEPTRRQVSSHEVEAVEEWVKAGNRLILLGSGHSLLFNALEVETMKHLGRNEVDYLEIDNDLKEENAGKPVSNLVENVDRLKLDRDTAFLEESSGMPLAYEERGLPRGAARKSIYVLHREIGRGDLVAVSDPGVITNRLVADADNMVFLLNTLEVFEEPVTVFINEYHHGFGLERPPEGVNIGGQVFSYLAWPFLQLFLLVVLFLVTVGRRFAAPRALVETPRRSLESMVASTAAFYQRSGARGLAFRRIYRGFLRRVARKYGLSSYPDTRELVELGERLTEMERQTLERDFQRMEKALQVKGISIAELQNLSQLVDRYRKEFNL